MMPSEESSPAETAVRIATLLTTVMNVTTVLLNRDALQTSDRGDLRSTLLWIADEMGWLGPSIAGGATAGISWPSDAQDRIERLRSIADAWDPVTSPPVEVLDAALDCLKILQPTMAK